MTVISDGEPKYNVVFDIDGVVATKSSEGKENPRFYLRKSAVFTAVNTTHYICPGIIELIQALYNRGDVRISFFSSAVKERNVSLVNDLMVKALGREAYSEIEPNTGICSRHHLHCNLYRSAERYGISYGNKHKDITKCLSDESELVNAVLIEDDSSYIAPGQEKNAVVIPQFEDRIFRHLSKHKGGYNDEGRRAIPLQIVPIGSERREVISYQYRSVESGSKIRIFRLDEKVYELYFTGAEEQTVEKIKLDEAEHLELIELLEGYYSDKGVEGSHTIHDEQLEAELYQLVKSLGGMTTKICKKANTICYLAGMIFSAIETAEDEEISLSEVLFRRQFKKKDGVEGNVSVSYEPQFKVLVKKERFYHIGLEKLREVNPEFRFHTHESYTQCLSGEFTNEELEFLAVMKSKEHDGCVIM